MQERRAISRTGFPSVSQHFSSIPNLCFAVDANDSIVAYDFLGDITFSKRLGFIEAGKDVGNMIQSAEDVMSYFSVVRTSRSSHYLKLTPLSTLRLVKFPNSTNFSARVPMLPTSLTNSPTSLSLPPSAYSASWSAYKILASTKRKKTL
jgi:hypothetical protein